MRPRIIIGTPKGTIILTIPHMAMEIEAFKTSVSRCAAFGGCHQAVSDTSWRANSNRNFTRIPETALPKGEGLVSRFSLQLPDWSRTLNYKP